MLLMTAAPAMAQLIRTEGSPHIYWVDRFGIRHHVATPDVQRQFFGQTGTKNVTQISWGEYQSMPVGGPVTFDLPPDFYNSQRDEYARYEQRSYSRRRNYSNYGGYEPRRSRRSYRTYNSGY
jgi:hypothetical protein